MKNKSFFIDKYKYLILTVFISLAIGCALLYLRVNVNYNLVDYLPKNTPSTISMNVMDEEFDTALPDALVMIEGIDVMKALAYKNTMLEIKGIDKIGWLDDLVDLKVPLEMADSAIVENFYKDDKALFNIFIDEDLSSQVMEDLYNLADKAEDKFYISGSTPEFEFIKELTEGETTKIMLFLVPLIIIILILTSRSWIEPLLYMITIGVAVMINMGTNLIFGEISYITNAVSPILQLAVSLDYAIFLLHSFEYYREEGLEPAPAMKLAMKRSLTAITASAATTIFGFAALGFMEFRIGADLGINLVKGVLLSYISVAIFLPALTLVLSGLIDKTLHKKLTPPIKGVGRLILKTRIPALILLLIIAVPAFLGQHSNNFLYGSGKIAENTPVGQNTKKINDVFGQNTPIVILVPRGDAGRELALSQDLKNKNPEITSVTSYTSTVGMIPAEYLEKAIVENFYSNDYSRIILSANTDTEGDIPFNLIKNIKKIIENYYPDEYYMLGESVSLYDIKDTITKDTLKVNAIAILAIILVILISFKSLTFPIILVLAIEIAIWVNLSIPYFRGSSLNYMGYLIISTVQLGATVDYAILLAEHYQTNRKTLRKLPALITTLDDSIASIMISATILSMAGFLLNIISSNQIIKEMGLLLARGTILSFISVVFILPALLYTFDKPLAKTTLNSQFTFGGKNNE